MSSRNYKKGRRKMSEKIKMFLFATVLSTAFSIIIANSFAADPVLAVKTSASQALLAKVKVQAAALHLHHHQVQQVAAAS
jgi:hypothetical protein